jgi:hypothetical protein
MDDGADHGQNLGELNMWSMMNLLETSLRVPAPFCKQLNRKSSTHRDLPYD